MLFKCGTVWINWPLALLVFDRAQGAFAKGPHSETDTSRIKLMPKYNTGQTIGSHLLQIFIFVPKFAYDKTS